MPSFLRYERVPADEGEVSDSTASAPDTPQHVSVNQRDNTGANFSEQESLLNSASPPDSPSSSSHTGMAEATGTYSGQSQRDYGPPKVDNSAPPPYSECDDGSALRNVVLHIGNPEQQLAGSDLVGDTLPPSYEEVQRIKAVEAQLETGDHILLPPHSNTIGINVAASTTSDSDSRQAEEDLLGTDLMFFFSFAAAFFFNWVGFVMLICFCHSVAGRSGALAGFGLSLAKWAVIVRHSTVLAPQTNTWLLWLIIVLGLVICMRAVLQYLNAKREWQHASEASRHRFLLFH